MMVYIIVQVMNLTLLGQDPCLPVTAELAANLRHLMLHTNQLATLVGRLNGLTSLETLSLRAHGMGCYLETIPAIDVADLAQLKHLRLMDFALTDLKVPEGCQLHVYLDGLYKGDMVLTRPSTFIRVLCCPMWTLVPKRLRSLCITLKGGLDDENMQGLQAITIGAPQLEFIRLEFRGLGSEQDPLDIFNVFSRIKRVVIVVEEDCWLRCPPSCIHSCKNLSVSCKGTLSLRLPEVSTLVRDLSSFSFQFMKLKGLSRVKLMSVLRGVGKHFVKRQMLDKDICWVHTQDGLRQTQAFDRLMFCGCHTCPECLFMDGKFMKDKTCRRTSANGFYTVSGERDLVRDL